MMADKSQAGIAAKIKSLGRWRFSIESRRHLSIHLMLTGTLIGILVGFVISLFRIAINAIHEAMLPYLSPEFMNSKHIIILLSFIAVSAAIAAVVTKIEPLISGSGIPQVSAQLFGRLRPSWQKVLPAKLIGGLACLGSGLSLGREGPSIQIGAALGDGLGDLLKSPQSERRYLLTGGAAAGLAAAFNAPISGMMFAMEELHRSFSPTVLVVSMAAAFSAVFVSASFFGIGPILHFYNFAPLPTDCYFYIVILGFITALSGTLFNKLILAGKAFYAKLALPSYVQHSLPFIITAAALLLMPELFGSGEEFIFFPVRDNPELSHILLLYVLKLALLLFAFCSGLPGGIFFPLLVLGSLVGNAYGQIGYSLGLWESNYILVFSLLAMCGHLTAIVRSPLTGILLVTELTSSFTFLLPLGISALSAFILAEFLKTRPIYEELQELLPGIDRDVHKLQEGTQKAIESGNRVLLELNVEIGSKVDGLQLKEIPLPPNVLIIAIKRGTSEFFPHSGMVVQGGDLLVSYVPQKMIPLIKSHLLPLLREADDPSLHMKSR